MNDTLEFLRAVDRVSQAFNRIPNGVATVAVNFFKDRFPAQNWVDDRTEPWPKRQALRRERKKKRRGLLVQSGRLRRSIRKISADRDAVVIGTDVPYARAHNEGVRATVAVKAHSRRHYERRKEKYTTKKGNERTRTVRAETGGNSKVKAHSRKMNLPRRQFMGHSAVLNKQIERYVSAEIMRALRGS